MVSNLILSGLLLLAGCQSPQGRFCRNEALRQELLEMVAVDQKAREGFGPRMTEETVRSMQAVDAAHLVRLKAILRNHGWPSRFEVGDDGAHAFWLLVQHADSGFMSECLPKMERAVRRGEAAARDYAYLLDRVRMQRGEPQVYGTQFRIEADGQLRLYPMVDPDQVDERRRKVGLPSMAEQEKAIREVYR